jgi:hypothetical protein
MTMIPRRAAVALFASFAIVACGSPETRPSGTTDSADTLRIEVKRTKGGDLQEATLTCGDEPSATGFIDDARAACEAVAENRALLTEGPPDNIACTEIYGGPQEAAIVGAVGGDEVDVTVTRTDGCGIANWDALEALLGSPEA